MVINSESLSRGVDGFEEALLDRLLPCLFQVTACGLKWPVCKRHGTSVREHRRWPLFILFLPAYSNMR